MLIAMLWADVIALFTALLDILVDVMTKIDNGLSLICFDG